MAVAKSSTAQRVWQFIQDFIKQHNYGPTYSEIMVSCCIRSKNTVSYHVKRLANRGVLTYKARSPRSIRLVEA